MMTTVCMLGHGDWVLLVLFTHDCMVQQYAMKKHWWSGFKEPWLLFQHQKVHLRASVIFHPFPQLRLGYIMMSNSFSVSHPLSSHQSFILTSPLQPPQSISVLSLFHILHWRFVALTTSLDFYQKHKFTLSSVCSWWWCSCNHIFGITLKYKCAVDALKMYVIIQSNSLGGQR